MERIRRDAGHAGPHANYGEAGKEALADPRDLALDQLLMDYTNKLDLEVQDEQLGGDKSSEFSLPKRIQEQLEED